jgi:hypothetical protein
MKEYSSVDFDALMAAATPVFSSNSGLKDQLLLRNWPGDIGSLRT